MRWTRLHKSLRFPWSMVNLRMGRVKKIWQIWHRIENSKKNYKSSVSLDFWRLKEGEGIGSSTPPPLPQIFLEYLHSWPEISKFKRVTPPQVIFLAHEHSTSSMPDMVLGGLERVGESLLPSNSFLWVINMNLQNLAGKSSLLATELSNIR